ncbi:hypothetical protein CRUP_029364 [Coryphaenoides rupestris]|nr:hypothetical protein CRUP_029364 [Coryphaenoides rupestris]
MSVDAGANMAARDRSQHGGQGPEPTWRPALPEIPAQHVVDEEEDEEEGRGGRRRRRRTHAAVLPRTRGPETQDTQRDRPRTPHSSAVVVHHALQGLGGPRSRTRVRTPTPAGAGRCWWPPPPLSAASTPRPADLLRERLLHAVRQMAACSWTRTETRVSTIQRQEAAHGEAQRRSARTCRRAGTRRRRAHAVQGDRAHGCRGAAVRERPAEHEARGALHLEARAAAVHHAEPLRLARHADQRAPQQRGQPPHRLRGEPSSSSSCATGHLVQHLGHLVLVQGKVLEVRQPGTLEKMSSGSSGSSTAFTVSQLLLAAAAVHGAGVVPPVGPVRGLLARRRHVGVGLGLLDEDRLRDVQEESPPAPPQPQPPPPPPRRSPSPASKPVTQRSASRASPVAPREVPQLSSAQLSFSMYWASTSTTSLSASCRFPDTLQCRSFQSDRSSSKSTGLTEKSDTPPSSGSGSASASGSASGSDSCSAALASASALGRWDSVISEVRRYEVTRIAPGSVALNLGGGAYGGGGGGVESGDLGQSWEALTRSRVPAGLAPVRALWPRLTSLRKTPGNTSLGRREPTSSLCASALWVSRSRAGRGRVMYTLVSARVWAELLRICLARLVNKMDGRLIFVSPPPSETPAPPAGLRPCSETPRAQAVRLRLLLLILSGRDPALPLRPLCPSVPLNPWRALHHPFLLLTSSPPPPPPSPPLTSPLLPSSSSRPRPLEAGVGGSGGVGRGSLRGLGADDLLLVFGIHHLLFVQEHVGGVLRPAPPTARRLTPGALGLRHGGRRRKVSLGSGFSMSAAC